jgi:osmotically inducible lipoprotein OsmB
LNPSPPQLADIRAKGSEMKRSLLPVAAVAVLALGGCANLSPTEQRVLSGGAIGVASGAAITAMTGGCVACGAAIGGAVGAAGGYVYDQVRKSSD